jgi:hypothetical protein
MIRDLPLTPGRRDPAAWLAAGVQRTAVSDYRLFPGGRRAEERGPACTFSFKSEDAAVLTCSVYKKKSLILEQLETASSIRSGTVIL